MVGDKSIKITKERVKLNYTEIKWAVRVYLENKDKYDEQEINNTPEDAEKLFQKHVDEYNLTLNTEDENTENDDIGRKVTVENCNECDGQLRKISSTVSGGGSFAASYKAKCIDCDNTQHIAAW